MTRPDWNRILRQTLEDRRLSRAEKRAIQAVVLEEQPSEAERNVIRSQAFDLAREEMADPSSRQVLEWLEDVVKAIASAGRDAALERTAQCCFTPDERAAARIVGLIEGARTSIDACVFTITDDRLAAALEAAHRRGVAVRIITDDDKASDRGSDVSHLMRMGIPVRMDRSAYHMHHKFALFDGRVLLNGSYNWTRSAAQNNHENFLIVDDPRLVDSFAKTFSSLWKEFA